MRGPIQFAVRILVAFILIVASTLKFFDFVDGKYDTYLLGGFFEFSVAQAEFWVGVCLLLDLSSRRLLLALFPVFVLFSLKAAYGFFIGEKSCGCFGSRVLMPPLYSLGLDLVVLLMLFYVNGMKSTLGYSFFGHTAEGKGA